MNTLVRDTEMIPKVVTNLQETVASVFWRIYIYIELKLQEFL